MSQLQFLPLSLQHRDLYHSFPVFGPNSKFSFAQGYIWQESYQTKVYSQQDFMLFTAAPEGEEYFVSPLLRSPQAIVPAMEAMLAHNEFDFSLHFVCEEVKTAIETFFPNRFTFLLDRDNSEYVYTTESLSTLAGKKLHQKRNHINAFCQQYSYTFRPYQAADLEGCMALQAQWLQNAKDGDAAETNAIYRALTHYDALELRAGVVEQDGQITAFSIGEKMGTDNAIIIFEKASYQYNGLFQLINRDTVANLFSDTLYINRCEDMGLEGLRKAKLSYRPCCMVDKYVCTLNSLK